MTQMTIHHCLSIFDLTLENATLQAVDKAFRRISMECHPDKDDSPEAKERYDEVLTARELLRKVMDDKLPLGLVANLQRVTQDVADVFMEAIEQFMGDPRVTDEVLLEGAINIVREKIVTGSQNNSEGIKQVKGKIKKLERLLKRMKAPVAARTVIEGMINAHNKKIISLEAANENNAKNLLALKYIGVNEETHPIMLRFWNSTNSVA